MYFLQEKMDSKQVSCDHCKKELHESLLLLHIGKNETCKAHYGQRYDALKKKKNRERMQLWRKANGKKELERQRELYKDRKRKKEFEMEQVRH